MNITVTHQVTKLAKCKDCGATTRSVRDAGMYAGWEVVRTERAQVNSFGAVSEWQCSRDKTAAIQCRECGSVSTSGRKIQATVDAAIECGDKCHTAKGPACECSCGGVNHGSNY